MAAAALTSLPDECLELVLARVAADAPRHAHGALTLVCKAWRRAILDQAAALSLQLSSEAGAASAAAWLAAHGAQLQQLELATVGLFSRHVSDSQRLDLFAALAAACGAAAAQQDEAQPAQQQAQQAQQQVQQQAQQQPRRPLRLVRLAAAMRLTPADCQAISQLDAPMLRTLVLQGSRTRRLGPDGARALGCMTQLTALVLSQLGIGDDAVAAVASALGGRLRQLTLSGCNVGPSGAAAVARHCTQLTELDLAINARIKDAGLIALCASLRGLRQLSLAGNTFGAAALQQLQELTLLTCFRLSSAALANAGLAAVAGALPQLQELDVHNNSISRVEPLAGLLSLTALNLGRNSLQIGASKVLARLQLRLLVLFAMPPKGVPALAGGVLARSLTSLALGADPSLVPEGSSSDLQLSRTRACSTLFGALAEAGVLASLAVPCTGLGDAQSKLLPQLAGCLTCLNLSYNCLSPAGLKPLRELKLLEQLELRAMRPELTDEAAQALSVCTRLQQLDLSHNDLGSDGVRQLSTLSRLQHLELRNNAQVEKFALLAMAEHCRRITHLNVLEISDVSARARPAGSAASSTSNQRGAARLHADLWAALPNLRELLAEASHAPNAGRGGRLLLSCQ